MATSILFYGQILSIGFTTEKFGPGPVWPQDHFGPGPLDPGPFGPRIHLGSGPVWAQSPFGPQGPLGPFKLGLPILVDSIVFENVS